MSFDGSPSTPADPTVGCDAHGRQALLTMEPDLRTLRGVLAAYRIFAQAADPVDPEAIAVLARLGCEATRRVDRIWRDALGHEPP